VATLSATSTPVRERTDRLRTATMVSRTGRLRTATMVSRTGRLRTATIVIRTGRLRTATMVSSSIANVAIFYYRNLSFFAFV
jgi:hypothetical protein